MIRFHLKTTKIFFNYHKKLVSCALFKINKSVKPDHFLNFIVQQNKKQKTNI